MPYRTREVSTYMELQHDLQIAGVPALFYKLFANAWSGVLTIEAEGSVRAIYFADGEPVFAESSAPDETLEAAVISAGLVTGEQAGALAAGLAPGQTFAVSLIEEAGLDEGKLLSVLRANARTVCLNLFALTAGPYRFEHGEAHVEGFPRFPQNPIELIATGLRRFVTPDVLASRLSLFMSRYVVRTEKFDRFRLHLASSTTEQGWLDAIDGSRTLRGISALNEANQREFLAFISVLRAADMIDFLDDPRITAERSPNKRPLTEFAEALPDVSSSPQTLEDESELESRIDDITARLSGGITYAQLLEVAEDADELEVHRAYRAFVEGLNGQRFDRLRPGLQGRVLPLLRAARDACNNLSDPGSRAYFQERRVVLAEGAVRSPQVGIVRGASMTQETIPVSSRMQRGGASEHLVSPVDED